MTATLTLTLPLPPRELHPNARVHWRPKAKAVATYRMLAKGAALVALGRARQPRWSAAAAQAVFYVKDRRRRDRDNLAASLKAGWDGIADAGVVENDAGITHLPVRIEVDAARPRVEITITQVED